MVWKKKKDEAAEEKVVLRVRAGVKEDAKIAFSEDGMRFSLTLVLPGLSAAALDTILEEIHDDGLLELLVVKKGVVDGKGSEKDNA